MVVDRDVAPLVDFNAGFFEAGDDGFEIGHAQGDVVQIWISDPNGQVVELQQSR